MERPIIPVEVKAEENLKAKSLQSYTKKYHPAIAVRTSMSDYRAEPGMLNIPIYAMCLLNDALTQSISL